MRKQRHATFQAPQAGSISGLSWALLACGESELGDALGDRGPGVARTHDNHWSPHSSASILLNVAGLEAWLNESTLLLEPHCPGLRQEADSAVVEKYRRIPERVAGRSPVVSEELSLVLKVRDEIAHFLPITVKGGVPQWLTGLQARGLLLTSPEPEVDYDFAVKLSSYALAYWAWETVSQAVADFLDALGPQAKLLRLTSTNFDGFRSLCPPNRLGEHDPAVATLRDRFGRWIDRLTRRDRSARRWGLWG